MAAKAAPIGDVRGARPLAIFGDSVTTDHISPAGSIKPTSPAGKYLLEKGVPVEDFNSYGARRGNHEVMVRGTFANVRIKNLMVPGIEGGVTVLQPEGKRTSIHDASLEYQKRNTPLMVYPLDPKAKDRYPEVKWQLAPTLEQPLGKVFRATPDGKHLVFNTGVVVRLGVKESPRFEIITRNF